MKIIVPSDTQQTRNALQLTWNLPGPIYYRIGKGQKENLENLDGEFDINQLQKIHEGDDAALIATGAIAFEALKAAKILKEKDVSVSVFVLSNFNPAPQEALKGILGDFPLILTVDLRMILDKAIVSFEEVSFVKNA